MKKIILLAVLIAAVALGYFQLAPSTYSDFFIKSEDSTIIFLILSFVGLFAFFIYLLVEWRIDFKKLELSDVNA